MGFLDKILNRKKVSTEWRTVRPLHPEPGKYCSNAIRTTKYTPLSFLPKNLYYQYRRVTIVFFTFISIVQFFPFSPYKPTWWASVLIIVLLDMIKEIADDLKRYRSDKELNDSPTTVVMPNGTMRVRSWKSLQPGDLVLLSNQHPVPADGVVLATSNEEAAQCFVDTANLDGETALKPKEAPDATHRALFPHCTPSKVDPAAVSFLRQVIVEAEPPSRNLYEWVARLRWPLNERGQPGGLTSANLALRGSTVRATSWALVMIIYTGDETRVMLSAPKPVLKRTMMEKRLNYYVPIMFALLFGACLMGSVVGTILLSSTLEPSWWFFTLYGPSVFWIVNALVFVVLLAAFVPLSLEISKIFVKVGHKVKIDRDVTMWYTEEDGTDIPVVAHTASLSEELGQVDYVFTDKTGTLTSNVMELLKVAIVDRAQQTAVPYGQGVTEIARILAAEEGRIIEDPPIPPHVFREKGNRFYDERVSANAWQTQPNAEAFDRFWLALALCHTIIVQTEEGTDQHSLCPATLAAHGPPRFNVAAGGEENDCALWAMPYEAESPDELALVIGAKGQGYVFAGRLTREMVVYIHGERRAFRVEKVNDFTSSRKRSSVVVQDLQTGKYHMFSKGADSKMLPRLSPGQEKMIEHIVAINDSYCEEALRGLIVTERELDANFLHDWLARWDTAMLKGDIDEKNAELSALEDELEEDLTLLGMTAVEDRLQDGVPTAIARLLQANMQVWMLTGDKVQTAINIGKACNLITPDMHLEVIEMPDALQKAKEAGDLKPCVDYVKQMIEMATLQIKQGCCDSNAPDVLGARHNAAVVMDGACLEFALEREWMPGLKKKVGEFLYLAMMCKSVLCCRLDPKQKGEVVRLVKTKMKAVTLAIGDGANDVNMITQAHVGVGISGKEGRQAVLASDYSFAQFRYVTWLTLVHGRLDYQRLASLILYHFQKNVAWIIPNFFFAFFNAFSGRKFITDMYAFLWNVAWTSLPIVFLALFDKDIELHELCPFAFPQLYRRGQENRDFTVWRFAACIAEGIYMGLVAFLVSFFFVYDGNHGGREVPSWTRGMIANSILIFVVNLRILFWLQLWDPMTLVITFGTIAAYCLVGLFLYGIVMTDWIQTIGGEGGDTFLVYDSLSSLYVWAAFITGTILGLLPIITWRTLRRAFSPTLAQVIGERTTIEKKKFWRQHGRQPTRRELIGVMRNIAATDDVVGAPPGPFGTVQGEAAAQGPVAVRARTNALGQVELRGADSGYTPDGCNGLGVLKGVTSAGGGGGYYSPRGASQGGAPPRGVYVNNNSGYNNSGEDVYLSQPVPVQGVGMGGSARAAGVAAPPPPRAVMSGFASGGGARGSAHGGPRVYPSPGALAPDPSGQGMSDYWACAEADPAGGRFTPALAGRPAPSPPSPPRMPQRGSDAPRGYRG